jgi:hypothetical protein
MSSLKLLKYVLSTYIIGIASGLNSPTYKPDVIQKVLNT